VTKFSRYSVRYGGDLKATVDLYDIEGNYIGRHRFSVAVNVKKEVEHIHPLGVMME